MYQLFDSRTGAFPAFFDWVIFDEASQVVLPQALRVIIPPLISQYLNLTKNSSLAIAVGYMDARATLGGITMNQTGRELECMLLLMGFYLIVSLLISSVLNWYNARVALKER